MNLALDLHRCKLGSLISVLQYHQIEMQLQPLISIKVFYNIKKSAYMHTYLADYCQEESCVSSLHAEISDIKPRSSLIIE